MRYSRFGGECAVKYGGRKYEKADSDKEPLNFVICSVQNKTRWIWNARELDDPYLSRGGTQSNVSRFSNRLRHFLNDEVYFTSPGLPIIVMCKS